MCYREHIIEAMNERMCHVCACGEEVNGRAWDSRAYFGECVTQSPGNARGMRDVHRLQKQNPRSLHPAASFLRSVSSHPLHATINWHINSTNLNNNAISGSFKIIGFLSRLRWYCLKEIPFNSIIYNATRVRLSVMYASTILTRRRNIITFRRTCSYMSYR